MRSVFRYPGGKTRRQIQDWIWSHRPEGMQEYREPFVGGGGIFFTVPTGIKRWINDAHPGLVAVYEALRDRPEEFIAKCKEIDPPSPDDEKTENGSRGGGAYNKRLAAIFDDVKLNEECDQAFRYFFINRTVFGGRVNYDIPSRLYFSNPDGWNIVKNGSLDKAAEHIEGTRITCGDYRQLLEEDGENVWIYADPPYVVNTNLSRSSQVYQHGFTEQDHRDFAEAVKACKHNVCISYDDDPDGLVRSLYDGFVIEEGSWKYAGTTNAKKADGRELLIMNYEPHREMVTLRPESWQLTDRLDDDERDELRECETVLEVHRRSFVWAGRALRAIRDSGRPSERLYREGFDTFEDYCLDRWGMSKSHANRLIAASEIIDALEMTPIGVILPVQESQARELSRLPQDTLADTWNQLTQSVDDPKELTAKKIRDHVNEVIGYEPPASVPQDDRVIRSFEKAENRLTTLKQIIDSLQEHEVQVVKQWLERTQI